MQDNLKNASVPLLLAKMTVEVYQEPDPNNEEEIYRKLWEDQVRRLRGRDLYVACVNYDVTKAKHFSNQLRTA
jgi:hypothetical protein